MNFPFETNGKLMILGVPILKHFRVLFMHCPPTELEKGAQADKANRTQGTDEKLHMYRINRIVLLEFNYKKLKA